LHDCGPRGGARRPENRSRRVGDRNFVGRYPGKIVETLRGRGDGWQEPFPARERIPHGSTGRRKRTRMYRVEIAVFNRLLKFDNFT
jgi:hypothetical protein